MRPSAILAALALSLAPVTAQETVLDALNELDAETGGPSLAEVEAIFETLYATACPRYEDAPMEEPQAFEFRFRYGSDDESQPERLFRLYQFFCYAGAYNAAYAFFSWDGIAGLQPLTFAQPQIEVSYANEFDDTTVRSIEVTGYVARTIVTNATFDPKTLTIHSESYWRGLGDASHTARWVFEDGEFVLADFGVDASYDEKVNPETLVDFQRPRKEK